MAARQACQYLYILQSYRGSLQGVSTVILGFYGEILQFKHETVCIHSKANDGEGYTRDLSAKIGFVLDYAAVSPAEHFALLNLLTVCHQKANLPWPLKGCLFSKADVLVWTFDFKKFSTLAAGNFSNHSAENAEIRNYSPICFPPNMDVGDGTVYILI